MAGGLDLTAARREAPAPSGHYRLYIRRNRNRKGPSVFSRRRSPATPSFNSRSTPWSDR